MSRATERARDSARIRAALARVNRPKVRDRVAALVSELGVSSADGPYNHPCVLVCPHVHALPPVAQLEVPSKSESAKALAYPAAVIALTAFNIAIFYNW